jgi:hypothetical protein
MGVNAALWVGAAIAAGSAAKNADDTRFAQHSAEDEAKRQRALMDKLQKPLMPAIDDAQATLEKRRSIASQFARRGRESTILTDPLGGGGLV